MNFTLDIKKELIANGMASQKEGLSALSAFLRTSGVIGERDGKPAFFIVSETEIVAEFFMSMFELVFGETLTISRVSVDRKNGKGKLVLEYKGQKTKEILQRLRLLTSKGEVKEDIGRRIIPTRESCLAYIKGAFLSCGSCTIPKQSTGTGYQLSFSFARKKEAEHFCDMLEEYEILAKIVRRSSSAVVYIKSKELISDFLSIVGTDKSLKKFSSVLDRREEANRNNRTANCFSGNADKTMQASVKQVLSIRLLEEKGVLSTLDDSLRQTAKGRVENPTLSMQELAVKLGISKSCLNHRLRKLLEIAEEYTKEK